MIYRYRQRLLYSPIKGIIILQTSFYISLKLNIFLFLFNLSYFSSDSVGAEGDDESGGVAIERWCYLTGPEGSNNQND